MNEISIKEIENIKIGQIENEEAATGVTVFISQEGMPAGLDIRGGGPAGRETGLLSPLAAADKIHAVVLGGGSAFGLDAAGGVMKYLEEQGIGFDVGITKVPLVCQSDIFDLTVGRSDIRPDSDMGYAAAKAAFTNNYRDGNFGAGCGATVGKLRGMEYCMKAGIGSFAVKTGDLIVGAVVVVNAIGDIYDYKTGKKIAGCISNEGGLYPSGISAVKRLSEHSPGKNTTIGIIITNAEFDKSALCKIASMGHDGLARCISPVHTSNDGDSVYAVSVGNVKSDKDTVGSIGAVVMSEAILRAVKNAKGAYSHPSYSDLSE